MFFLNVREIIEIFLQLILKSNNNNFVKLCVLVGFIFFFFIRRCIDMIWNFYNETRETQHTHEMTRNVSNDTTRKYIYKCPYCYVYFENKTVMQHHCSNIHFKHKLLGGMPPKTNYKKEKKFSIDCPLCTTIIKSTRRKFVEHVVNMHFDRDDTFKEEIKKINNTLENNFI